MPEPSDLEKYLAELLEDVTFVSRSTTDDAMSQRQANTEYALAYSHVATLVKIVKALRQYVQPSTSMITAGAALQICDRIARAAMEKSGA